MSDLNELLAELVAIDSINPDLIAGAAGEGPIAEFVAGWSRDRGLAVEVVGEGARLSVIATARGTGSGRSLLLNGHLDTVGVGGMDAPHTPQIRDGRMYGRGTYDMKGGLAAILDTAVQAAARGLRGDVIVTLVADEEVASIGTEAVLERVQADAAIVVEPTELQLAVAHKGFAGFEVETTGVAAHGSRPHLGVDAIAKMGPILVALKELDGRLQNGTRHPLLGTGSLHASLIEGGQELSSYPERCLLRIERRTVPGETLADVEAQIAEIAPGAAVRPTFERVPFEVAPDAPIVSAVHRHAIDVLGREPATVGHAAWMDAAVLSAAGIPTVVFGPSGAGAHAVEEWVDLASVERVRDVCLAVASEWCA